MEKGQASIEFLLVLITALLLLSVSANAISNLHEAALFTIDVKNAKSFLDEANAKANLLILLGEGSESAIETSIIGEWEISQKQNELTIKNPQGKEKIFAFPKNLSVKINEKSFTGKNIFILKKEGQSVSIFNK